MSECYICYDKPSTYRTVCGHNNSCYECWYRYENNALEEYNLPTCMLCRSVSRRNLTFYGWLRYLYNFWLLLDEALVEYNEVIYGQPYD